MEGMEGSESGTTSPNGQKLNPPHSLQTLHITHLATTVDAIPSPDRPKVGGRRASPKLRDIRTTAESSSHCRRCCDTLCRQHQFVQDRSKSCGDQHRTSPNVVEVFARERWRVG